MCLITAILPAFKHADQILTRSLSHEILLHLKYFNWMRTVVITYMTLELDHMPGDATLCSVTNYDLNCRDLTMESAMKYFVQFMCLNNYV